MQKRIDPEIMSPVERQALAMWDALSPKDQAAGLAERPWMTGPVWKGDPRFLSVGTSRDRTGCGLGAPDGLRCTRSPGHDDDHASHLSERLMVARWGR